jgi:hypothetical protein
MLYKALGFAVWKGAKWYLRRRASSVPTAKLVVAGVLVAAVATGVALGARRDASGSEHG